MLHNPKWNETKPDLSIDSLIAWLEKMPRDGYYASDMVNLCMLAQWVQSMDPEAHSSIGRGNSYTYRVHGADVDLTCFMDVVFDLSDGSRPRSPPTFGAALERAKRWKEKGHV